MTSAGRDLHDFREGLMPHPQLLPAMDGFLRVPNPRVGRPPGHWAALVTLGVLTALLAIGIGQGQVSSAWAVPALLALAVHPVLVVSRVLWSWRSTTGNRPGGLLPLRVQAALVQAQLRRDEETLHQVRSMVAGISLASQVLDGGPARRLPAVKRHSLQDMQRQEIRRLARLVCDEEPESPGTTPVDLDHVLEPLVVAARARGTEVRWDPSGVRAIGKHDDIAGVVQVLVENAERHAPGSAVTLEVRASPADVTVRVTDAGGGVPPRRRAQVFEWGERRPGSPGRGIGLSTAHDRARALRGSLAFEPAPSGGASFVLRLPPATDGAAPCPAPSV